MLLPVSYTSAQLITTLLLAGQTCLLLGILVYVLRLQQDGRHDIRSRQFDRAQLFERLAERGSGFDCAILPRAEPVQDLQRLLKSLTCPVILVA